MPFEKGSKWNGNANGRPKRKTINDYITPDEVDKLVRKAIALADKGDSSMIKTLLEHVLGKPRQNIGLEGEFRITPEISEKEKQTLIEILKVQGLK
jgi:hypothetical protein